MNNQVNPVAEALIFASIAGHVEKIEALIAQHAFPRELRALGAEIAAAGGHTEAAALLVPVLH